MTSKLILWIVVSLGLLTPIWLASLSYWAGSIVIVDPYSSPEVHLSPFAKPIPKSVFQHDSYMETRIGPLTVTLHPRRWASGLIFAGSLLIIIGVAVLAHVR